MQGEQSQAQSPGSLLDGGEEALDTSFFRDRSLSEAPESVGKRIRDVDESLWGEQGSSSPPLGTFEQRPPQRLRMLKLEHGGYEAITEQEEEQQQASPCLQQQQPYTLPYVSKVDPSDAELQQLTYQPLGEEPAHTLWNGQAITQSEFQAAEWSPGGSTFTDGKSYLEIPNLGQLFVDSTSLPSPGWAKNLNMTCGKPAQRSPSPVKGGVQIQAHVPSMMDAITERLRVQCFYRNDFETKQPRALCDAEVRAVVA